MRTYLGPSVLVIDELGCTPRDGHQRLRDLPGCERLLRAWLDRADIQPLASGSGSNLRRRAGRHGHAFERLLHHATVVNLKSQSLSADAIASGLFEAICPQIS